MSQLPIPPILSTLWTMPPVAPANTILVGKVDGTGFELRNLNASGSATINDINLAIGALNLGSASTHAAGDFVTPYGFMATIASLNLGSASTHSSADFALSLHTHDAIDIISGTFSQARIPPQPWASITGKPAFATVATSGLASDLAGTLNVAQLSASVPIMAGGKINAANLPALAIVEFLGYPASQVAMLALVGQRGDWAIRTDTPGGNTTWRLITDDPTQLANWVQEANPGSVTSVNGFTGPVVLTTTNLAEGTNKFYTDVRADARVTVGITALNLGTAATQNTGTGANQIVTRDGSGNVVGQVTARQQTDAEIAALTPAAGELLQSTTDPTKLSIGDGTTAGGLAIGADVRTLAWNVTPAPASGSMNVVYVYTDTRTASSQATYANLPLPQKFGQRVTVVIQVASGHSAYSHAFTFGGAQVSFRNASGGLVTLDGGLTGSLTTGKNFYLLSLVALNLTDWLIESTNFSTAELQAVKDNNDT